MKKLFKTSLILLSLLSVIFTSCRKEYEVPPISEVPVGKVLTIDDILAMPAKATFDTISSVFGIVTADEQSGNLYKAIFIQDRATGKAIELKLNTSSAARIGDSVRVCLDSTIMYNPYYNLPQLTDSKGNGINPDGRLLIYPYNDPIEPKLVTIADIMTGNYVGALVRIENASFRLKNAPFCEPGETTNRVLDDTTFMNSTDDPSKAEFVVRTSNYANFAYDYMPISKGSLVAIASIYKSTYQLTIRSKSEMEFAEWGAPVPPTPPTPMVGDGSRENPYKANDIITLGIENSDGNKYWVKDYIVGYVDGDYVYQFGSNTDVKTNIILSSNVNTSDATECIPIQLPSGAVREGLNLSTNPGNLHQEVLLYGTLEKYFQVPAVKNVSYAEINGNSFGSDPGGGGGGGHVIFSETFASGQGNFTIQNVNLPSQLSYVWKHTTYQGNSYMKASAYVSQCYAAESWLVSPAINLSAKGTATLKFEHAINKGSANGRLFVMVSTNYSGDVNAASWTELVLDGWPAGNNWTFMNSSADLAAFAGQKVYIAFKYTSEAVDGSCPTWEVKNFVVEE